MIKYGIIVLLFFIFIGTASLMSNDDNHEKKINEYFESWYRLLDPKLQECLILLDENYNIRCLITYVIIKLRDMKKIIIIDTVTTYNTDSHR